MKKSGTGKAKRSDATAEFVGFVRGAHKARTKIARKATTGKLISDSENPPLTAAQLARARPVSRVKRLRWRLGMSQREFSAAFGIPVGTLRDWEQRRSKPDAPARSLLAMIEDDPKRAREVISAA